MADRCDRRPGDARAAALSAAAGRPAGALLQSRRAFSDRVRLGLERDGTLWIVDAGNRRLVRHDDARHSVDGRADGVVGLARETTGSSEPLGGPCTIDDSGRLWLIGSDGTLRWWHHAALRNADAVADGRFVSPAPRGRLSGVACGADALWLIDATAGLVMRAPLP